MLSSVFDRVLPGLPGWVVAGVVAIICLIGGVRLVHKAISRLTDEPAEGGPDAAGLRYRLQRIFSHWLAPAVLALVLFALTAAFASYALSPLSDHLDWVVAYCFAFFIGGGAGMAELISRYKDDPFRAVRTIPAVFYISLNAFGSVAALYLIYMYRAKLGFTDATGGTDWSTDPSVLVQAVMLAGFSSLLFFRTALFKFRVGDADLAIGPSIFLDTLLAAADRAVDRVMAKPRATFVHDLMGDVSFEKAAAILPGHCIALMQNLSSNESQAIGRTVSSLRNDKDMPDKIKALNLGLALLSVVGEKVLKTAVDGLRRDLQDSTAKLLDEVAKVMHEISFALARKMLPDYCFALWSKPLPQDQRDSINADMKALSLIADVPEEYKSLLLGIRLARLTDGATLQKAVSDLHSAIKAQLALPSPDPATLSPTSSASTIPGSASATAGTPSATSSASTIPSSASATAGATPASPVIPPLVQPPPSAVSPAAEGEHAGGSR